MAWMPKIAVVDDYTKILPNQKIRRLRETHVKQGEREYTYKKLSDETVDVEIMPFDGAGVHTPEITGKIQRHANIKHRPTSILWRSVFFKGVTTEIDFKAWFKERGIFEIKDMFGETRRVDELDMIVTKSMWKAALYFNSWEDYEKAWHKYNHCMAYVKFNFSRENESVYTRANYQILQDLPMKFDDFMQLADYSKQWAEKLAKNDKLYTMCFLGIAYGMGENGEPEPPKGVNAAMKAALRNPDALKDPYIRRKTRNLAKKYIREFNAGKLFLKSAFRFAIPDLIALLEYAAGKEPAGVLREGEFYTMDREGTVDGDVILERNPHISRSEHVLGKAVGRSRPEIQKWLGELANVVMFNIHDNTMARLSGCDHDGDLINCIRADDYPEVKKAIDMTLPVVMNEL